MADLAIRNEEKLERDPFRIMREMLKWDPFREMEPLLPKDLAEAFEPDFEVKETNDAYLFKADVPGVKEADIEVTITGNRLNVAGSFTRAYTLPEGADLEHLHADLKAGVLTIAVPKLPEVKPKKVEVKAIPVKA